LLSEFEELGVKVVGTSVDTVERLQRFRDKHSLGFALVSDSDRAIGEAFGTLKSGPLGTHERDTVLIGADGTILLAYQRAKAAGHAAAVLAGARRLREEGLI
jgi:thioredoxin-dependent peroxiredoxin